MNVKYINYLGVMLLFLKHIKTHKLLIKIFSLWPCTK